MIEHLDAFLVSTDEKLFKAEVLYDRHDDSFEVCIDRRVHPYLDDKPVPIPFRDILVKHGAKLHTGEQN